MLKSINFEARKKKLHVPVDCLLCDGSFKEIAELFDGANDLDLRLRGLLTQNVLRFANLFN